MQSFDPSEAMADILVVDDNPDNIRFLAAVLMQEGYSVRKALDGPMALMACQTLLPDIILLDIMMPNMDGYSVCKQLKDNPETQKIPVIFLSAINDVLDKVKAFQVGGVDYITKPFQAEEVLVRVQNQLALCKAEQKVLMLNIELENRVKERTLQLENLNQKLWHMAWHDSLTNLPNRAFLLQQLEKEIEQQKNQPDYHFSLLFLDCDRFKIINDSLGHLVGDELLIAFGARVLEIMPPQGTLARLGGDEFAIILSGTAEIQPVRQIAEQILQALTSPFQITRGEVFITASIGIVLSQERYQSPQEILRDADTAMYQAKSQGTGHFCIFTPDMYEQALKTLRLENDLKRAIERQELTLHYQPIVSLPVGRIQGFEALIRWQHPQLGMVSPLDFIPIAEEIGLISKIDLWVLETACQQLHDWHQVTSRSDLLMVSINLSVDSIARKDIVDLVLAVVQRNSLVPSQLKIEITESAILEYGERSIGNIKQLQQWGIQFAIDDFGTGYSSLSYLHQFPFDYLKIDRSFISCLSGENQKKNLISTIIDLAKKLDISTIAEGVETLEQFRYLQALGCQAAQGYFFAKPLESHLALELLTMIPQW